MNLGIMTTKILVAHHKPGFVFNNDVFQSIHVGKMNSNIDLGTLGDDSGVNISNLNAYYCELTATYWAWKNIHADFKGICHYRRYFYHKNKTDINDILPRLIFKFKSLLNQWLNIKLTGIYSKKRIIENQNKQVFLEKFTEWIKKNNSKNSVEIYCLKPIEYTGMSNLDHFSILGKVYLDQLINIVSESHPKFRNYIFQSLNSDKLYYANMIIMKDALFNEYCQITFDILAKHYDINKDKLENYSRISGYMAEIITNSFILMKKDDNIKIEYLNELFIE